MAPPCYGDLGKNARDVFGKGYHFGLLKLDLKTKTTSGVEFSSGGVSNRETGKVFGALETKYKFKEYGVTFTEKWNTDNVLATEIGVADFCQGAKVSLVSTFAPHTGDKSVLAKSEYKNENVALNCDVDFKSGGPLVLGSLVLGYNGWLAGYAMKFDAEKTKLVSNNFSLGYAAKDFVLHTNVDDGQDFGASVYQKTSDSLSTAIQLSWSAGSNEARFGIGCKYDLDEDSSVRAKVNNQSQVGLGYSQKVREGVTLTFSALIDGKNFSEGGHKVGFCLEMEA
ncbi:voltage-dependent anion-selective channel-like [Lycorma delicatula]|uniref:voltage-dependent anion-selective channel-like n=1 Tax=Lycorma delicatula TaxID=130591 RepID=UPI003F511F7E